MGRLVIGLALVGVSYAQQPQLSGVWKAEGTAYRNLNGSGAVVEPAARKIPASRSLVEVFPAEPVIPTTAPPIRAAT